jgi:hypothetical protein
MPYFSRATNCGAESRATMKIEMKLTAADFERLWINSMKWMGEDWEKQEDRFDPKPFFSWHYAYWFDNYAALKLAEAFISTLGKNYAIHSDEGTSDWVMLTNYASPCHVSKRLVSA